MTTWKQARVWAEFILRGPIERGERDPAVRKRLFAELRQRDDESVIRDAVDYAGSLSDDDLIDACRGYGLVSTTARLNWIRRQIAADRANAIEAVAVVDDSPEAGGVLEAG